MPPSNQRIFGSVKFQSRTLVHFFRQVTRSALWVHDRFVVWGGPEHSYDASGSRLEGYARDGAAWDPATDSWSPIPDLPSGFIPLSGVADGDRLIAFFQATRGEGDDTLAVLQLRP